MASDAKNVAQKTLARAKAQTLARNIARVVTHTDPPREALRKRARLEGNLEKWLVFFFPELFFCKFAPEHVALIKTIDEALDGGNLHAVAMPRGHGKTTIIRGCLLYALLTGKRKFFVVVAATSELAEQTMAWVKLALIENERLHEYYPHVTAYMRASEGKAIRANFMLRRDLKSTQMKIGKLDLQLPEITNEAQDDGKGGKVSREEAQGYPSNGAIVNGRGMTGAIRGIAVHGAGGVIMRPDFVLIDDPQTRESAESQAQCAMRERIITGDILGLAGPTTRIAAVMPCTIVRRGDVADSFLDSKKHPEWQGRTTSLVIKWPDAQETLWQDYAGVLANDGLYAATAFYRKNRKAMDKGGEVTWKQRIRNGELSALQTAQNLRIEAGAQFWAEYQNEPLDEVVTVYTLTPEVILSRSDKNQRGGVVPEWATVTVAATDVNPSYGLTTTIFSYAPDGRKAVVWYAIKKVSIAYEQPDPGKRKQVHEALASLGRGLAALPCRPELWVIDGGGTPQGTVTGFAAVSPQICGLEAVAAFGRAATKYRPRHGKLRIVPGYEAHRVVENRDSQWIIWNADYWKESAQLSFTGELGAPGSASLPAGNHRDFAEQICREQLQAKGDVGGQMVWRWSTAPGPHDYLDCAAMCDMAAGWRGIGLPQTTKRERVKLSELQARGRR